MNATQNEISVAVKALETARQQFDFVEAGFFEHTATESALRQAYIELKDAERGLAQAHAAARREAAA